LQRNLITSSVSLKRGLSRENLRAIRVSAQPVTNLAVVAVVALPQQHHDLPQK
jgi:hypothetical protein